MHNQSNPIRTVGLDDKYSADAGDIYITGVQALVRLVLAQRRRDRAAGLNTAAFISGYRGSPLGTLDRELWAAQVHLAENDIVFNPGLNEDLAATSVWGSQQVGLFPGATKQGVFGVWYAKAPGVDRSGDALRHANFAGTSAFGGVLALAGDDHGCKSASLPSQSDFTFRDASIPVLNPCDIEEVIRFGLIGLEMSRYSGLWIGMKCLADTMDSAASISIGRTEPRIVVPQLEGPPGGVSIRWPNPPLDQEALVYDWRLPRAVAFARANGVNRIVDAVRNAEVGIVVVGKSLNDVRYALLQRARRGAVDPVRLISVGMPWPLDGEWLAEAVSGLKRVLVVEEKRSLVEEQLASTLYRMSAAGRPALIGKTDETGKPLLTPKGALGVEQISIAIAHLLNETLIAQPISSGDRSATEMPKRVPYFCSGCPHNRSTRLPEGSIGLAGIGCHYMAQWMDRDTKTFTQMGAEGASWIGAAPFTTARHAFVNLGDGTYAHSGLLAIRAAIASKVTLTYKLLFNDAVAMTGGQQAEGGFTVQQIVAQLRAEGVKTIRVVAEEPDRFAPGDFPPDVTLHPRADLDHVQRELRDADGVTVLLYDQVCAAEKRRRRKRGTIPQSKVRAVINTAVCEGCGDCGVQSNCVSLVPVDTIFGRKRQIDQTSCNQDMTCLDGFCPSFVTVEGPSVAKGRMPFAAPPAVPEPLATAAEASIVIGGIGGTGIVTVGAILGMAAHLEGRPVSVLDMIGLSQKGGEVLTHLRIGRAGTEGASLPPPRIAAGDASLFLGCDLLTAAAPQNLALLDAAAGMAVINTARVMTGDFAYKPNLVFPSDLMLATIAARTRNEGRFLDATAFAESVLSDAVGANILVLGYAWQLGEIPLSAASILRAIELNGAAVGMNTAAFAWGRALAQDPDLAARTLGKEAEQTDFADLPLDKLLTTLQAHLTVYQNESYARRYRALIDKIAVAETDLGHGSTALTRAAAVGYHKLLAYKDEYEVARLLSDPIFLRDARSRAGMGSAARLVFHLAPPILPGRDKATGRPKKRAFRAAWTVPVFRLLARFKGLRGTAFDPFGWMEERKQERASIALYERDVEFVLSSLSPANTHDAVALLALPAEIRGYGPVKSATRAAAAERRTELLARLLNAERASSPEATTTARVA